MRSPRNQGDSESAAPADRSLPDGAALARGPVCQHGAEGAATMFDRGKLDLEDLVAQHAACLQTEGRSPKTLRWYRQGVLKFCLYLKTNGWPTDARKIRPNDIRGFISYLQQEVSAYDTSPYVPTQDRPLTPGYVDNCLRAVRGFFNWLEAEGYINDNPVARIKLPKLPRKLIRALSQQEVCHLLAVVDPRSPTGLRDQAIILLFLDTGLRLSELTGLCLTDLHLEEQYLIVMGKGVKERQVPFGLKVRDVLRRYIEERINPVNEGANHVFLTQSGRPIRDDRVQKMLAFYGQKAGVRVHPHLLRHTFAKNFFANGGDPFTLQRILGHSTLEMTRRYVSLLMADVQKVHAKASPVDNLGWAQLRLWQ